MSRIGLFGGSFNPAHIGHRRIAAGTIAALGLDQMWWLVSPGNPLKDPAELAPLPARFASARAMARGLKVRVTAIERELGTVYTADTIDALARRFPEHRFVWVMGADNLAQFHLWRDWERIARTLVIAVAGRPGYEGKARAAPAMGWLRRYVRPADQASGWTEWTLPALVLLDLPPQKASATAIRADRPAWHHDLARSFHPQALRDGVTRRPVR
jgi:nicotinate-nucleotide adenylyltransferase